MHGRENALAKCLTMSHLDERIRVPLNGGCPARPCIMYGDRPPEMRSRLETAVHKVLSQCGALVRQVAWSDDQSWVRLEGIGCWVQLWVDAQEVHATGDIPILGALLGRPVAAGLKQILQQTFRKQLT